MELYKIYDYIETQLRNRTELPESEWLLDEINRANEEICRELRIPIRLEEARATTAVFTLPDNVYPDGMMRVYRESDGCPIPIYRSVQDIAADMPRWTEAEYQFPAVLITDTNPGYTIAPVGFETTDTLRIVWQGKPTALNDGDDQPFDGELAQFHILVPYLVLADYFTQFAESELDIQKAQFWRGRYWSDLKKAWAHTDYPAVILGAWSRDARQY